MESQVASNLPGDSAAFLPMVTKSTSGTLTAIQEQRQDDVLMGRAAIMGSCGGRSLSSHASDEAIDDV